MLGKGSLVTSFSVHTVTPVLRRHPELHCNMCPVREASVFLGGAGGREAKKVGGFCDRASEFHF